MRRRRPARTRRGTIMAAPATLHLWTGWPHVLRAQQFDPPALDCVFREAKLAEEIVNSGGSNLLKGKIVLTLFYEPSTRTRLSFEFATYHLGGRARVLVRGEGRVDRGHDPRRKPLPAVRDRHAPL